MRLKYQNKKESHDITLNLNTYIDNIHVFLDPAIEKNGILKQLKKKRIIKEITGYIFYNNSRQVLWRLQYRFPNRIYIRAL